MLLGPKKNGCLHVQKKIHLPRIIFKRVCTSYDHNAKIKYAQIGKPKFQNKHYMVLCEINELVLLDKNQSTWYYELTITIKIDQDKF